MYKNSINLFAFRYNILNDILKKVAGVGSTK